MFRSLLFHFDQEHNILAYQFGATNQNLETLFHVITHHPKWDVIPGRKRNI